MKIPFFEYHTTKNLIFYWDEFTYLFWGHLRIYRAYDVILDISLSWWTDDEFRPKGNKCVQNNYRLLHICKICGKKK